MTVAVHNYKRVIELMYPNFGPISRVDHLYSRDGRDRLWVVTTKNGIPQGRQVWLSSKIRQQR